MMWVDKRFTLKQMHMHVFNYFRPVFGKWLDWKDPNTTKEGKEPDLRTDLIDFPYVIGEEAAKITKAEFMALDTAKAFDLCFPGVVSGDVDKASEMFDIAHMPYKLTFKDISGYYEECHYCEDSKCGGCAVPFTDFTIEQILTKNLKLASNDTFFGSDVMKKGKELQL